MKKKYQDAELEIVLFNTQDVVVTSDTTEDGQVHEIELPGKID